MTQEQQGISRNYMHVVLSDGRELRLESANPDLVRFDITAAKHKYPSAEAAPMLWATFVSWAAARRTNQYDGGWEKWRDDDCLELEFTDKDGNPLRDDDDPELVDPTRSGPEPD